MAEPEYLLFIETSGNQSYIYATNKLRENIGASELTYRAGTQWVLDAAGFSDAPTDNPNAYREWLEKEPERDGVEVVVATSGKALLVVSDRKRGQETLSALTARAAKEAPGLSVAGAMVELRSRETAVVAAAMAAVHERFNANRDLIPTPAQRFAMLPFCEPCATSGLPASGLSKVNDEEFVPSAPPTVAKRRFADDWFKRIKQVFRSKDDGFFIASSVDQMEREFEGLSWVGVVYSDGNGLGQIMMQFERWLAREDDYLATLRRFSVQLDRATEDAFYAACRHLYDLDIAKGMRSGGKLLPVIPLLLGGDDLTALVHGRFALPFARAFLEAFERETAAQPTIASIAAKALATPRLSAGAGVAIVKAHFPFHSAHALADSLLKSAKIVKKKVRQADEKQAFPCSAMDFHILFDTAFSSLDAIRTQRRTARDRMKLWGGPYVVTPTSLLEGASGRDWAQRRHIDALVSRVDALIQRGTDGRPCLPRSQMHMLREALPQGKQVADARLAEITRFGTQGLSTLVESEPSLFDDTGATRFLDALVSAAFWGREQEENRQ